VARCQYPADSAHSLRAGSHAARLGLCCSGSADARSGPTENSADDEYAKRANSRTVAVPRLVLD
jgi:hypothetical protein